MFGHLTVKLLHPCRERWEPRPSRPSRQQLPETRPIAHGSRIDPPCDPAHVPRSPTLAPAAFTIQAAGAGSPRALCAPLLDALCAASDDEPDWAARLLAAGFGGESPGRPIHGIVVDDPTDQRMRVKVGAR